MTAARPLRKRNLLWHEYAFELRTVAQLSVAYGMSVNWIRKELAAYRPPTLAHQPSPVVVILDATYFGRSWGVLVALNAHTGAVLYYAWLEHTERTVDYEVAVDTLESLGYTIEAAVIDGRRGVREMLLRKGMAVQHCQFHQLLTRTQCLTRRPKLLPNQELRAIALTLTKTTQEQLETVLATWHETYGQWLKERDPYTKQYLHRRTRQAYFSLRRNLPYLFTYQAKVMAGTSAIPNTTNKLDGRFGAWKTKLKAHRGCSRTLKSKMLVSFFSRVTEMKSCPD